MITDKPERTDELRLDWRSVFSFVKALTRFRRLYVLFATTAVIGAALIYLVVPPRFTAIAVVGPPRPSPTGSMVSAGSVLTSTISRTLAGSSASAGADPYQQYLQLIPSSRLCQALAERSDVMQTVYSSQWDAREKRWKSPGPVRSISNFFKWVSGRPFSDAPTADELADFLSRHLVVRQSGGSGSLSLFGSSGSFTQVSLDFQDPREAERVLNVILNEPDRLIREDQRRDVTSRISFLRRELSKGETSADERTALISILTDQEQMFATIEADQRYASAMIVAPHASGTATYPPPFALVLIVAVFLATGAWVGVVMLTHHNQRIHGIVMRIEAGRGAERHQSRSGDLDGFSTLEAPRE